MNIAGIKIFLTKFQTEELADIQLCLMDENFARGEFSVSHMITKIPKDGFWIYLYDNGIYSIEKEGTEKKDYLTVTVENFIDCIRR